MNCGNGKSSISPLYNVRPSSVLVARCSTNLVVKKNSLPSICLDVIFIPQLNAGQNLQHISPTFFPILFNPLLTKLSYQQR